MDDETYVKIDFRQLPGETFFVAKSKFDVSERRYEEENVKNFQ